MISETFESTLQFMSAELATALDANLTQGHSSYKDSVTGIHEVQTFLKIMTALLDRYMLRESSPSEAGLTGRAYYFTSGLLLPIRSSFLDNLDL